MTSDRPIYVYPAIDTRDLRFHCLVDGAMEKLPLSRLKEYAVSGVELREWELDGALPGCLLDSNI